MFTRDHILAEIRRTAEANGGQPLGRGRFESETGTRESDWSGRYWTRWGDAILEAGLEPNELQGAIPRDDLVERLASGYRTPAESRNPWKSNGRRGQI